MKRSPARSHRAAPLRAVCTLILSGGLLLTSGCVASTSAPPANPAPGSATAELHSLAELDRPPIVRVRAAPQYPFLLRKKRLTEKALAEFIVTKKGDVVNAFPVEETYTNFGIAAAHVMGNVIFRLA